MTEESFRQCQKLMRSANHIRGLITAAKNNVAKWTSIEDGHRRNLRENQANGAKKMVEKAIKRLEEQRAKLAALKFPDSNLPTPPKEHTHKWYHARDRKICEICGEMDFSGFN